MIIPSIDIMDGKAVQLVQGKRKVIERDDVFALAREFSMYGDLAVIDIDAALSKGDNSRLIKELCRMYTCRVGGGIRSVETARMYLKAGAKKIIIGTMANRDFLGALPRECLIAAIDTKDGFVVDRGWTRNTSKTPFEVMRELEDYVSEFLFTDVNVEGTMNGVDSDLLKSISESTSRKVTISGGISSLDDIRMIEGLGMNAQVGMALYTGKIGLADAFISVLDFKCNGLIPTIVQDERGQVLMLSFSSPESVKKTFDTQRATYYSRRREALWIKGETSGNFQEFMRARYDCDRDSLIYTVRQKNFACHTGSYSCFGDREFSIGELYAIVRDRIDNPKNGSYTSEIASDEENIKAKITEEALELVNYKDRDNLVWEAADLLYFMLVFLAKNKVALDEVISELGGRRK